MGYGHTSRNLGLYENKFDLGSIRVSYQTDFANTYKYVEYSNIEKSKERKLITKIEDGAFNC